MGILTIYTVLLLRLLCTASFVYLPSHLCVFVTHTTREEDDDWDQDIQAETRNECAKFGPVQHVAVDKESQGFVYIKFTTVAAATAAQKALDNRFFGGRTVSTEYQFEKVRWLRPPYALCNLRCMFYFSAPDRMSALFLPFTVSYATMCTPVYMCACYCFVCHGHLARRVFALVRSTRNTS